MSDRLPLFDSEEENNSSVGVRGEPVPEMRRTFGVNIENRKRSRSSSPSDRNATGTVAGTSYHQYEELMSGSIPCPSCNGSGRIPKERESELVALIPVNDKRLKPRRTWLWVLLGVAICLIICTFLLFFLIPRSVDVNSDELPIEEVMILNYRPGQSLFLNFLNPINVSNHNYYNVRVANATGVVINRFSPLSRDVIGKGNNKTGLDVRLQSRDVNLLMNYTVKITGTNLRYCESAISKYFSLYIVMQFDVTVTFEYLNHHEQDTLSTVQQVCCVPSGNCTSV